MKTEQLVKQLELSFFRNQVERLLKKLNQLSEIELRSIFQDAEAIATGNKSFSGVMALVVAGAAKTVYEEKFNKPMEIETKAITE